VIATGEVSPLGKVTTKVCVIPGIAPLAPCGDPLQPEPLETVALDADGTFELHAAADSLPDALLGIDVPAAEAVDERADFPDPEAIRAAKADMEVAKASALREGALYGPGTYRVATIMAARIEEVGFFGKAYCAREIIVVKETSEGNWADVAGKPIFGLPYDEPRHSLAPAAECLENSPP
jgi:hypothetical protein